MPGQLIITVDVEDWQHSVWDRSLPVTECGVRNTETVLGILSQQGKKATFFILGKLAEAFPQIVKRIASEGHEVASHGYGHVNIDQQTPAQFRADIRCSKLILENLIGEKINGYRAPNFSIKPKTTWALDILAEEGFIYDSSIFPIKHKRYGIVGWPPYPTQVQLPSGRKIIELPIGTLNLGGREWPVGGGGYHRLLSRYLICKVIRQVSKSDTPFMMYCHPYEFAPHEFAEIDVQIPLKVRLHQGLGRAFSKKKFEQLLSTFNTTKAYDIATKQAWPEQKLGQFTAEAQNVT